MKKKGGVRVFFSGKSAFRRILVNKVFGAKFEIMARRALTRDLEGVPI